MRSIAWMPAAALLVAAGCSEPAPLGRATTPEASRAALTAAQDGWKAGETPDTLARRSTPIHLADDDFTRGRKLADYRIEGEPKEVGTGLSYVVTLTFRDGDKPAATRRVAYRVVTEPNTAITREEGIPK